MFEQLKALWQELSHRGSHGLDYASARRVVLVNQFCMIAIALNLVYAAQVIAIDATGLSVFLWLIFLACLAFLFVMYLNNKREQRVARWILSSIPVATLITSAYLISRDAGLQLYLIVIWTLLFLIYTRDELGALLLFSAVYWLAFLLIEFRFSAAGLAYDYPPGVIDQVYAMSVTGCFLAVALVVGLFFNEIHRAEKRLQEEFERSENLLRNILPASIADRLKRHSNTDGHTPLPDDSPAQAPIADGYREATVLFADIVGFTPLSAKLTPDQLVSLLNRVFSNFDDMVLRHGLEKIKTIGDAYMLVGGLPERREDHASAVADTALHMQALMPEISRSVDASLQLRIGIHCGPLVAGVIGRHKFAYDIWGDTVNTASRLESQGLPGRIQISGDMRESLTNDFVCEPRGIIDIKGKGPTETWLLLDRRT